MNESVKKKCGRTDCKMCEIGCKTDCCIRGIVYELLCVPCKKKILYRGQSGRSGYERINEHFDDWKESKDDTKEKKGKGRKGKNDKRKGIKDEKTPCVLHGHSLKYHDGKDFEVEVRIISQNFGDPMKRLITESVLIEELKDEDILNNKNEWSYIRLPKVSVSTT